MSAPMDEDALGRHRLTQGERIRLLEQDRENQSRIITELVDQVSRGFTSEQMAQIRTAFREELADAGLRIDEGKDQDAAREDFRWLRRARLAWDGAARRIGTAILSAGLVVLGLIVATGFWSWIANGGKPPT